MTDLAELMRRSGRLPDDPIPGPDKCKDLLIDQILEFHGRYLFQGPRHTREMLAERSMRYLERLCDMQLLGIATSQVTDRHLGS